MTDQVTTSPAEKTESPQKMLSAAELMKFHGDLKKKQKLWMTALGSAVVVSIGASSYLHPAAGVLLSSLYVVLFTHSSLYKITAAVKQANHTQTIFNLIGEDAINKQLIEQFDKVKKNSEAGTKTSGAYI